MTERKPPGMSFETFVERQIREAQERGAFDNLPGAGRPIPGIDGPDDELWWVRQLMRRENLSYLPPSLALRKEAEDVLARVAGATSEAAVRELVAALNEKIAAALRVPVEGPPLNLMPLDVDEVVDSWRRRRTGDSARGSTPGSARGRVPDATGGRGDGDGERTPAHAGLPGPTAAARRPRRWSLRGRHRGRAQARDRNQD